MVPRLSPETIVAVVGPTATGKSLLAVALAEALGGEVVNADPQQFYRGMDIGTAKATPDERRGVPHHQVDTLDVTEEASVGRYQREARQDVDAILARGRRPIVVGGSGLYLRALLDRLDIPPTDPDLRGRLEARAREEGPEPLYAELAGLDPAAAERISPANVRRVIRALEVATLTGSFSASLPERRYLRPTAQLGLRADTATLDGRIDERCRRMWEGGLLDETRRLLEAGLRDGKTASRAIGYSEGIRCIEGEMDQRDAVESTSLRTRRLARRQARWFNPDPRISWIDLDAFGDADRVVAEALRILDTVDP